MKATVMLPKLLPVLSSQWIDGKENVELSAGLSNRLKGESLAGSLLQRWSNTVFSRAAVDNRKPTPHNRALGGNS